MFSVQCFEYKFPSMASRACDDQATEISRALASMARTYFARNISGLSIKRVKLLSTVFRKASINMLQVKKLQCIKSWPGLRRFGPGFDTFEPRFDTFWPYCCLWSVSFVNILPLSAFNVMPGFSCSWKTMIPSNTISLHMDGLVQERHDSSALAMEWRLSCTKP